MPDSRARPRRRRPSDTARPSRFAARLWDLRLAAGLTLVQLAAQAGISPRSLMQWRAGRNGPTWETVLKLCAVLRCTPNDFL